MQSVQIAQPAELIPMATDSGHLVWVPKLTVDAMLGSGGGELRVRVGATTQEWLTVTEAAREHLEDVDGLTLDAAKMRVMRACNSGTVKHRGVGRNRRVEPGSLRAWRLSERERELDAED